MARRNDADDQAAEAAVQAILAALERQGRHELAARLEQDAADARHQWVIDQHRPK